ncbi:MAG: AMP-binding protein, partial [Pseudomonadota bacterium]
MSMTLAASLISLTESGSSDRTFEFWSFGRREGDGRHYLTAAELLVRSQACAARLQDMCKPADRAVILCPPGLDYIVAFYACQLAGIIAVPAYPPSNRKHLARLWSIIDDADASVVLSTSELIPSVQKNAGIDRRLPPILAVDDVDCGDCHHWVTPDLAPDAISFLQYTSGTTGNPKGVVVSHERLLSNVAAIAERFQLNSQSRGVFWLPPYHDMGLIGALVMPVVVAGKAALMSPASFLQQPLRWLDAISEFQATITAGPDFAYQLCVDAVRETDPGALDLSRLRLALSGAETVRAATLDAFVERFEPFGFRRESFVPVYGLAETVLMASGQRSR